MANQNVPTHRLGGAIILTGNSFPSAVATDETFGSYAQQRADVAVVAAGATTVDANVDPYLIIATSNNAGAGGTHTITFPNPSADLVGRLYTVLFGAVTGGTTTVTLSVAGNATYPTSAIIPVINGVGYVYYATATGAIIIKAG
jgi:hypothetical protein